MPGVASHRLRVGVPYRSGREEALGRAPERYLRMVERAGGEPYPLSLAHPRPRLEEMARRLDAFVLPGSPADVHPSWYHAAPGPRTASADAQREQTDFTLLDVAFQDRRPVLAICYGMQSLNVYLGGTLLQHIPDRGGAVQHDWDAEAGAPEPFHAVRFADDSLLAEMAAAAEARVNSSHHQAVDRPGRGLRIAAVAPDGIVEALAWAGREHWIVGVQWHPERLPEQALSRALFDGLVVAAGRVAV